MTDILPLLARAADATLIFPYRLPGNPVAGFYCGTLALAAGSLLLGQATAAAAWLINRGHFEREDDAMVRMHNLSVAAIEAGDKAAYKAANRQANEAFGKAYFAGAALFSVSVWPLPFALAWMAGRFADVSVPLFPGYGVRYHVIFLLAYIALRLAMARVWRRLPFFRVVEEKKRLAAVRRGRLRPWTELGRSKE